MVQGACSGAHADVHDHGRKDAAAGPGGQERYLTAIEFRKQLFFSCAGMGRLYRDDVCQNALDPFQS